MDRRVWQAAVHGVKDIVTHGVTVITTKRLIISPILNFIHDYVLNGHEKNHQVTEWNLLFLYIHCNIFFSLLLENNFIIQSIPSVWVFIFNQQTSWTINFFLICILQGLSSLLFSMLQYFGRNAILILNKRQAKTIQSVTVLTFTDQNLEKM